VVIALIKKALKAFHFHSGTDIFRVNGEVISNSEFDDARKLWKVNQNKFNQKYKWLPIFDFFGNAEVAFTTQLLNKIESGELINE